MKEANSQLAKLSIWCAIILFIIRCFINNKAWVLSLGTAYELFGYAGEAIGLSAICTYIYEKSLWKVKWLNIYKMPVLASHYEGSLMFTWNGKMGDRQVTMEIEQTFLSVKVHFKTGESESVSINASIENINGDPYLLYLYLNTPNPNLKEISPIHYGHAKFKLDDTTTLVGDYFTDRNTVGRIEVKAKNKTE